MRVRSFESLLSPSSSLDQHAASGDSFSRAGTALPYASSTLGTSPGA